MCDLVILSNSKKKKLFQVHATLTFSSEKHFIIIMIVVIIIFQNNHNEIHIRLYDDVDEVERGRNPIEANEWAQTFHSFIYFIYLKKQTIAYCT